MPIYEYRCRHCDSSFEEIVLSRDEAIACPTCASAEVERELSVFSSPGNRPGERAAGGGCGGCGPSGCGCH